MKKTSLYCDRCDAEGNEVRAVHKVWIRTSVGARTQHFDVCEEHLAVIVGPSSNGAAPPPRVRKEPDVPPWAERGAPGIERALFERFLPYIAKRDRFSFDDAVTFAGKDAPYGRVTRVLDALVKQRKVERLRNGIYQRPGFTMRGPTTVDEASIAALKLIKSRPGMRTASVRGLIGVESDLWKSTLAHLRGRKLVRTKGNNSGMRIYPF